MRKMKKIEYFFLDVQMKLHKKNEKQNHSEEEEDNRNVSALIQPNQYEFFIEIICRESNDFFPFNIADTFRFLSIHLAMERFPFFCVLKYHRL